LSRTKKGLERISKPICWHVLEAGAHLAKVRAIKHLIPWFRPTDLNVSCLPINEDIKLSQDTVLPFQVLKDFVERASHRVIVDFCACRVALECKRYSKDIGCLMMGKAALDIHPSARREVSVEEALKHAGLAMDAGLVPFIGKVRLDNLIFGVRNRAQLLSVCFCCECCCISRFAKHLPLPSRSENLRKLKGLRVEVSGDCDGCGVCAARCFLEEISVESGRAVIGEGCAGCGRCASICPRDAITVSLENPAFIDEARARIEELVDIN